MDINRRGFLFGSAAAAMLAGCATRKVGLRDLKPGEKLRAAIIGYGIQARTALIPQFLGKGAAAGSVPASGILCEQNFDKDFHVRHFPEQVFTGYDVAEFEALFQDKPVVHLRTAATDGVLELVEGRSDFAMTDEDFRLFSAYHLQYCETRELLGSSAHLLYICRKQ